MGPVWVQGTLGPLETGRKAGSTDLTQGCLTYDGLLPSDLYSLWPCAAATAHLLSLPSALHSWGANTACPQRYPSRDSKITRLVKTKDLELCAFSTYGTSPPLPSRPCAEHSIFHRPPVSASSLTCWTTLGKLLPSSLSEFLPVMMWG